MSRIAVERVYDDPAALPAGKRILVDRLWPRGLTKERAALDLWLKEIAPSTELRREFHSGALDWDAFRKRYIAEVDANPDAFAELLAQVKSGPVLLLYGSHDTEHNHALILRDLLQSRLDGSGS
ncbi:MAG: DUF488 family protein [Thermomicrobiales bacterium]|nr:DUF488 family protein [Thermomicrobiales bacterium]